MAEVQVVLSVCREKVASTPLTATVERFPLVWPRQKGGKIPVVAWPDSMAFAVGVLHTQVDLDEAFKDAPSPPGIMVNSRTVITFTSTAAINRQFPELPPREGTNIVVQNLAGSLVIGEFPRHQPLVSRGSICLLPGEKRGGNDFLESAIHSRVDGNL